jgi:P4 family phage/plasmid primase-like protien
VNAATDVMEQAKGFLLAGDADTAKRLLYGVGVSPVEFKKFAATIQEAAVTVDIESPVIEVAAFDPLPLVPQTLKALPNWVTFESKDSKAPMISGTSQNAKSNDPSTWVDYTTACENIRAGKGYTGLGFVTDGANSNNLVGFDFDGCRNPETGELTEWTTRMLSVLGATYSEVTVSGTGLRAWVIAPLGKNIKFEMGLTPLYYGKNQKLEVFGDGLYFTMSGNRLPNAPSEILTLDATKMGEVLALAHSLAVEAPKPEKVRGAYTREPDEGFTRLFETIGWTPLVDRMNKMADTRFHNLTVDAGKMTYCPMPGHQPRSTSMRYTPCFGALKDEPAVVHCFGCDFSGDMVKTVFEFDGGEDGGNIQHKNMYDCARAICTEYGLNFEEFFPTQTFPAGIALTFNQQPDKIAESAPTVDEEPEEGDERHRITLDDVRNAVTLAMEGEELPPKFSQATAAEFFHILIGRDYKYAEFGKVGEWMKWSGSVWYPVNPNAAMLRMQALVKRIKAEIIPALARTGEANDRAVVDALRDLYKRCGKAEFLNGVMKFFLGHCWADMTAFDSEEKTHLVNFLNGTFDLATSEFHKARREDLLTQLLPVVYRPEKRGQNPTWDRFLRQAFPKPEMRAYLQRFFGYMLEGTGKEKTALFFHGYGDNGKSIMIEVLMGIFGYSGDSSYGRSAGWDSLNNQRNGEIRNDIARLHNARAVFCDESEAGMVLNEKLFKALTGTSAITARFLHKEFFTFFARFVFLLATNRLPKVTGGDDALWIRINKVPMPFKFPKGHPQRIENLKALLAGEREAITLWILDGYRSYLQMGLQTPEEVLEASREYRQNSDMFEWFFHDVVDPKSDPNAGDWKVRTLFEDLFRRYTAWCRDKNEKEQTRDTVMDIFRSRGYVVERSNNGKGNPYAVKGLVLTAQAGNFVNPNNT